LPYLKDIRKVQAGFHANEKRVSDPPRLCRVRSA
jgi:hypothetical protein